MEIAHWNNGTAGRTEVDASFLGDKVMSRTLHAAAVMYQANQRAGTHKTRTRGEINRSKRQVFRQKGHAFLQLDPRFGKVHPTRGN